MTNQQYFESISSEERLWLLNHYFGVLEAKGGTNCPQPAPTNHPTPNGHWECGSDNQWYWIPDIG